MMSEGEVRFSLTLLSEPLAPVVDTLGIICMKTSYSSALGTDLSLPNIIMP